MRQQILPFLHGRLEETELTSPANSSTCWNHYGSLPPPLVSQAKLVSLNFPQRVRENNFHERWARSIKVPLSTEESGESENLASSTYLDSSSITRTKRTFSFSFSRKNSISNISILLEGGLLFRREFRNLDKAIPPRYYFHYRNFDVTTIHKVYLLLHRYILGKQSFYYERCDECK